MPSSTPQPTALLADKAADALRSAEQSAADGEPMKRGPGRPRNEPTEKEKMRPHLVTCQDILNKYMGHGMVVPCQIMSTIAPDAYKEIWLPTEEEKRDAGAVTSAMLQYRLNIDTDNPKVIDYAFLMVMFFIYVPRMVAHYMTHRNIKKAAELQANGEEKKPDEPRAYPWQHRDR